MKQNAKPEVVNIGIIEGEVWVGELKEAVEILVEAKLKHCEKNMAFRKENTN